MHPCHQIWMTGGKTIEAFTGYAYGGCRNCVGLKSNARFDSLVIPRLDILDVISPRIEFGATNEGLLWSVKDYTLWKPKDYDLLNCEV